VTSLPPRSADAAPGRPRRLAFVFVLATVVIDAMGIGLIMPIMPSLLQEVQGGSLSDAALWGGILATGFAVMQFLFGPVIGSLSDAIGRRPVMLISLAALAIDYLVMAVAGSLGLMLAARIFGGLLAATHATAAAAVADLSRPEEKAANFGLIGAAFGAGFVLGPLLGGVLAEFGTRAPFLAASGLCLIAATFGALVMPETVTPGRRRAFNWREANPFGAFRQMRKIPGVAILLLVLFLFALASHVYPSVWSFYTKARFDWDPAMIGISLATYGICMALVQGWLIRPALRWAGERRTVVYGLLFEIAGLAIFALLSNGTLALILIPVAAMGALAQPALQGIMSRAVADTHQGALQGVIASVHALAMILSPLLMTATFAAFTHPEATLYQPGAPFVLALVLMTLSLLLFRFRAR